MFLSSAFLQMQSWTKWFPKSYPRATSESELRGIAVSLLQYPFRLSKRRACRLAGQNRNSPRRRRDHGLLSKRELLRAEYPHHFWGYFHLDQKMDGRILKSQGDRWYSRLFLAIRVSGAAGLLRLSTRLRSCSSSTQRPFICGWTMARSSSLTPSRSGMPWAVAIRITSHQVHHGETHLCNRSTSASGMNSWILSCSPRFRRPSCWLNSTDSSTTATDRTQCSWDVRPGGPQLVESDLNSTIFQKNWTSKRRHVSFAWIPSVPSAPTGQYLYRTRQ